MNGLENLRKRARQMVRDHRAGLVTVAERLRRGLPRFAGMTDREVLEAAFSLNDAHRLVANELGFPSWDDLVVAPDAPAAPGRDGTAAWRSFPQVFVRDPEVSLAWYRDVLGFAVDDTHGELPFSCRVSRDAALLDLRRTESSPWAPARTDDELRLAARIEVGDVKALFLEVRDRGATFHRTLRTEPWGQQTFVVRDPDGNLLSFGSPIP